MDAPDTLPVWQTLLKHKSDLSKLQLTDLFAHDEKRFERFSLGVDGFFLDHSKNRVTEETMQLLFQLAQECQLDEKIDAMFAGDKINLTEQRAVLHTALRDLSGNAIEVDGQNIAENIYQALQQMHGISEKIRQGKWLGFSSKPITKIIHIGIGGSDLGPKMVVHALQHLTHPDLNIDFVSNVDGDAIAQTIANCSAETTLFIVASKSFTTSETIINAQYAKNWLLQHMPETAIKQHMIAISSNIEKAHAFGIEKTNILPMWDWVGGRYSLWSTIGLPIAILMGMDVFKELLAGAHSIDEHFRTAYFNQNLPVLLALIGIWNHNFFHMPSNAILPYCEALKAFPDYLQQLEMESNGKQVDIQCRRITEYQTAPIIWGTVGTDGQHSFHQLLHQGTAKVYCDFIAPLAPTLGSQAQHDVLIANCFAQSQALMQGRNLAQVEKALQDQGLNQEQATLLAPHKVIPGNRSSITLLFPTLSPYHLGGLIALYEHKVFTQGVIWHINAFDQWGVELGKQLANDILPSLSQGTEKNLDASTQGLSQLYRKHHHRSE